MAFGVYDIFVGTVSQASGRFLLPQEVTLGLFACGLSGFLWAIYLIFEGKRKPKNGWLKRFSKADVRRNQRTGALAMCLFIALSYFIEGVPDFSIAPVNNFGYGVIVNMLFGLLSAMSFCGCALSFLVEGERS